MPEAARVKEFSSLLSAGQPTAALKLAEAALVETPLDPYWLNAGALALHTTGDSNTALNWMGRAIALAPQRGDFQNNYGVILRRAGCDAEAVAAYQRALLIAPDDLEALRNLTRALTQLDRAHEAVEACMAFCKDNPESGAGLLLAGQAALAVESWTQARQYLEQAVGLLPEDAEAWRCLAQAAAAEDDLASCEQATRAALQRAPERAELHNDLGACLTSSGRYEEAIAAYSAALDCDSNYTKARYNRGTVRLRLGDWAQGWRDYDARLDFPQTQRPESTAPLWDGEPVEGSLLIHAEQGLGDTLQFLRFLPLARARCQHLTFEVQPALLPLLQGCAGADAVIARGASLPKTTARLPLLSLPGRLGLSLEDLAGVPIALPGLPLTQQAREADAALRVGLVWAGNPKHSDDRHRSIPPAVLEPLFDLPSVRWSSLQFGQDSLPWPAVENRSNEIADWRDTARLLNELDLLVAVDTSVAHLAASLGKPVWMMIAARSDWRWMLDRTDTPWYPSARLFRQPVSGDWSAVVAAVRTALVNHR